MINRLWQSSAQLGLAIFITNILTHGRINSRTKFQTSIQPV